MNKKILLWAAAVVVVGTIVLLIVLIFPDLQQSLSEGEDVEITDLPELSVKIVSPEDGYLLKSDSQVMIFALAIGSEPVEEISFWVDGVLAGVVPIEEEWRESYLAEIEWMPPRSGGYSLSASVISQDGTTVGSLPVNIVVERSRPTETVLPTSTSEPEPVATTEESGEQEEDDETYSRCDLFEPEKTTLILLDLPKLTNDLTIYLSMPNAVWGLEEDVPGDDQTWEYSALLGTKAADACEYWGYSKRLYCTFEDLSESFFGETHPLDVYVNYCDEPIYSHGWVSVMKPACQADLEENVCEWVGGEWECDDDDNCACSCP